MAWLYVPGLAASNSGSPPPCPDTAPPVTWRGKDMPPRSWRREWKRGTFLPLQSTLTSEPSTVARGVASWISSLRDTLANPSASPGLEGGGDDPRHLWPEVYRILREVRPRLVFLENVPGHLSMGFGDVLGDLAKAGFNAEWGVFSAAEVGAPHLRKRVFVLAFTDAGRAELRDEQGRQRGKGREGETEPRDHGKAGGWPTLPPICGGVDGVPYRVDRLRALGNAVVPAQAAHAWRVLAARAGVDMHPLQKKIRWERP